MIGWKRYVDEQKNIFQNNVKEMQEKLAKTRQKSFFVVLKGIKDNLKNPPNQKK